MKALVLSLIIAFSSSFALANGSSGCVLAGGSANNDEGAYKKHNSVRTSSNSVLLSGSGAAASFGGNADSTR